jgi:hypothetical protein
MSDQTVPVPVELLRQLKADSTVCSIASVIDELVALIPPPRKRPTRAAPERIGGHQ